MKIIKLTPWLLAGAFGIWCVLVWVFGNEWKALFVYYPLYPWCLLVEHVHKTFQAWLIAEPRTATGQDWLLLDRVHGLLYFVSGVVWYFFVGLVIRKIMLHANLKHTNPTRNANG